jgi:hypothetical protein
MKRPYNKCLLLIYILIAITMENTQFLKQKYKFLM